MAYIVHHRLSIADISETVLKYLLYLYVDFYSLNVLCAILILAFASVVLFFCSECSVLCFTVYFEAFLSVLLPRSQYLFLSFALEVLTYLHMTSM